LRLTAQKIDSTPVRANSSFFFGGLRSTGRSVPVIADEQAEAAAKRIVISAADIANMRGMIAQRGTPPSSTQIQAMIDARCASKY
jgi:hypothetical protein